MKTGYAKVARRSKPGTHKQHRDDRLTHRLSGLLLALLLLPLALSCEAQTTDNLVFSPQGCEFSATMPGPSRVEDRYVPTTGRHAMQAATTKRGFPWFVAQCTTGDDGSAPPDIQNRLQRASTLIASKGGTQIRTSTFKDQRGQWAKATGTVVVDGHVFTMTVANVAGARSMLFVLGVTEKADAGLFDRFVASVTHNRPH